MAGRFGGGRRPARAHAGVARVVHGRDRDALPRCGICDHGEPMASRSDSRRRAGARRPRGRGVRDARLRPEPSPRPAGRARRSDRHRGAPRRARGRGVPDAGAPAAWIGRSAGAQRASGGSARGGRIARIARAPHASPALSPRPSEITDSAVGLVARSTVRAAIPDNRAREHTPLPPDKVRALMPGIRASEQHPGHTGEVLR